MKTLLDRIKLLEQESTIKKEYDSFIINVKYDVGYCDIDEKNLLLRALQKTYKGWDGKVYLNTWSFNYKVKNSDVELKLIKSVYYDETYEVIYNQDREEFQDFDAEEDIFNFVKKIIEGITYYSYRSEYSMDTKQKASIKILSVTKESNQLSEQESTAPSPSRREKITLDGYEYWLDRTGYPAIWLYDSEKSKHGTPVDVMGNGRWIGASDLNDKEKKELLIYLNSNESKEPGYMKTILDRIKLLEQESTRLKLNESDYDRWVNDFEGEDQYSLFDDRDKVVDTISKAMGKNPFSNNADWGSGRVWNLFNNDDFVGTFIYYGDEDEVAIINRTWDEADDNYEDEELATIKDQESFLKLIDDIKSKRLHKAIQKLLSSSNRNRNNTPTNESIINKLEIEAARLNSVLNESTAEEKLKQDYEEYDEYMYKYEKENGHYPPHLSNGQWQPFSFDEYKDKTKNGTKRLQFP